MITVETIPIITIKLVIHIQFPTISVKRNKAAAINAATKNAEDMKSKSSSIYDHHKRNLLLISYSINPIRVIIITIPIALQIHIKCAKVLVNPVTTSPML